MTVQELLDALAAVEDKTLEVYKGNSDVFGHNIQEPVDKAELAVDTYWGGTWPDVRKISSTVLVLW